MKDISWDKINWDEINLTGYLPDFREFYGMSEFLLNQYYPNLANFLSWRFLYITPGGRLSAFPDTTRGCLEELPFLYLSEWLNYLNRRDESKFYFYLLEAYDSAFAVLCVNDKKEFNKMLHLDSPIDLYHKCPFFVDLLRSLVNCRRDIPYVSEIKEIDSDYYHPKVFSKINFDDMTNKQGEEFFDGIMKNLDELSIQSLLNATVSKTLNYVGLPYISFFHSVANSNYEGTENKGYIEFFEEMKDTSNIIEFFNLESLERTDNKFIRKLVEMTDKTNRLLLRRQYDALEDVHTLSQWEIRGLGHICDNPLASVHFMGFSRWELFLRNEQVSFDGKSLIIKHIDSPVDQTEVERIRDFFEDTENTAEGNEKFMKVFEAIRNQPHGTMLVVSYDAEKEAERLSRAQRAISVKPFDISRLEKERLIKLSSIDGAILIDPNCICYALGVILDGHIDEMFAGNSGRGARYNSAKLYIHNIGRQINENIIDYYSGSLPKHALAVVVSEDGYINVFSSYEFGRE